MEKNILITGTSGNLGSYLSNKFLENNNRIISVSRKLLKKKNNSKKKLKIFIAIYQIIIIAYQCLKNLKKNLRELIF